LAIDPGFVLVVKLYVWMKSLYNETIKEEAMAMKKIRSMVNSYKIDAISIGNGTASHETEFFKRKLRSINRFKVLLFQKPGALFIQHLKLHVKSSQIMM
jgi:uncharacterized protein